MERRASGYLTHRYAWTEMPSDSPKYTDTGTYTGIDIDTNTSRDTPKDITTHTDTGTGTRTGTRTVQQPTCDTDAWVKQFGVTCGSPATSSHTHTLSPHAQTIPG